MKVPNDIVEAEVQEDVGEMLRRAEEIANVHDLPEVETILLLALSSIAALNRRIARPHTATNDESGLPQSDGLEKPYAVVDRVEPAPVPATFIKATSIEEAIRWHFHATHEVHVMEGDETKVFGVRLAPVEIRRWR